MSKTIKKMGVIVLITVPWLCLLIISSGQAWRFYHCGGFFQGAYDVSRRVTAPDGSRTALLVRSSAFDMNYRLYLVQDDVMSPSCEVDKALWVSHDYNPDPRENFHEDLEWSADASVIAVIVDGQYTYGYDFSSGTDTDDPEAIRTLLESHRAP